MLDARATHFCPPPGKKMHTKVRSLLLADQFSPFHDT